jgi:hypothetical protein
LKENRGESKKRKINNRKNKGTDEEDNKKR